MAQIGSSKPRNSNPRNLRKQLYADLESTDTRDYNFLRVHRNSVSMMHDLLKGGGSKWEPIEN